MVIVEDIIWLLLLSAECLQDKEYTMDEVAEELGLTRERVRQLKNSAENKLRKVAATEAKYYKK